MKNNDLNRGEITNPAIETLTVSDPARKVRLNKSSSLWQIAWERFKSDRLAVAGAAVLITLILMLVFAPVIAVYSPTQVDVNRVRLAPNATHFFGTDDLGRDVFSRVLWGGRETLSVGFLGVIIAVLGGSLIGLVSSYLGGWIDVLVQRFIEIMLAFPVILLLLSIVAALGPGLMTVLLALGLANIPWYARLVRGSVLSVKEMPYIDVARSIGARDGRIMFKHILPNILSPILIYATMELGYAIMVTAGLSYIGLGAQPPSPEWGAMLNYGRTFLRDSWWMSVFPGLGIFLVVLSINLMGEGIRDALDPKMS